jgi:GxxExxY protein
MGKLEHGEITREIIGLAMKVHNELGPGFVEKVYQRAMYLELKPSKLKFEREKKIGIVYKKALIGYGQVDFIVDNKVLVELKAVTEINDIHIAQMISYLKAAKKQVGLILNFAGKKLEWKRVVVSKSE